MSERRTAALLAAALAACPAPQGPPPPDPTPPPPAASVELPSCPLPDMSSGTGSLLPPDQRARCRKRWTVLLYLAADAPDLPDYAYADLRSVEQVYGPALAAEVDVLVELDVDRPDGLRRFHLLPGTGPAPTGAELRSPPEQTLADESLAPGEQLAGFLDWGLRDHPSQSYAVVVWGHGQGWRPRGPATGVRHDPQAFVGGVAFDDSQRSVLDIPTLADRLDAASDAWIRGRPFDLLIVDACLMQSAEVALALADTARFIVGHEQIDPYVGLPYGRLLPALPGGAPPAASCVDSDEACRVAAAIPGLYRGSAPSELDPTGRETYALSAIAATPLQERLQPSLEVLGATLVEYLAEDPLRAIDLQDMLSPDETPGFLGGTRDLGVVLARLQRRVEREPRTAARDAVLAAIADARAALSHTVLAVASGGQYEDDAAVPAGLSVWLPHTPDEYAARGPTYATAPLHGGAWGAFIARTFTPPE